MAEGLSRCFCVFSNHALRVCVCLTAFQVLLVPSSWLFNCLLGSYVSELERGLQLYEALFGCRIRLSCVSQSTGWLCKEMSFSRPWSEDLNDLNGHIGELGMPRQETQICFGAAEDLLHGLNWATAAQCLSWTGSMWQTVGDHPHPSPCHLFWIHRGIQHYGHPFGAAHLRGCCSAGHRWVLPHP